MRLWTSGEVDIDVADGYREARNWVEEAVNQELTNVEFSCPFIEWAFIGIVRKEDDRVDYPEIQRKHKKRKVLEFRLKIDHQRFKVGDNFSRRNMIIESLKRSVGLMRTMGITQADLSKLQSVLENVGEKNSELR